MNNKPNTENQENPTAAIIVIGNEILSGRTKDKNINYIATELNNIGIRLKEVRVIADIESVIIETINQMRVNFDYIFTTGGIGPTHDDITTESISKALGLNLEIHLDTYKKMEDYYKGEMNEGRKKMAKLPEGAEPIENIISIAPGFKIENIYVLAGIPNVAKAMFDNLKYGLKEGQKIFSKELRLLVSESKIAKFLTQTQSEHPEIEIGSYPFVKDNKIGVSIALRSTDKNSLDEAYKKLEKELSSETYKS